MYQWINKEKSRYYTIAIQKQQRNELVLSHFWGACNSNRGGTKNISVPTEDEAIYLIDRMLKRRKSRGYELITPIGFII